MVKGVAHYDPGLGSWFAIAPKELIGRKLLECSHTARCGSATCSLCRRVYALSDTSAQRHHLRGSRLDPIQRICQPLQRRRHLRPVAAPVVSRCQRRADADVVQRSFDDVRQFTQRRPTGRRPVLCRQSGPAPLSSVGNLVLASMAACRAIFS